LKQVRLFVLGKYGAIKEVIDSGCGGELHRREMANFGALARLIEICSTSEVIKREIQCRTLMPSASGNETAATSGAAE
jgi:hypothetical protein